VTLVFVAFRTDAIDTSWAGDAEVVVVHNDDREVAVDRADARHVHPGANVGFGGGVNRALPDVTTERVVLCNPDIELTSEHWAALTKAAGPDELVTVPLVDGDGRPTSVVSAYPSPLAHLLGGWRLGRYFPRGGRARRALAPLLGRWGRDHDRSLSQPVGAWPLTTHWVSGAVVSVDAARLRAVGGFDEGYFLYYEDVDLCRRLADAFPAMTVRVAGVDPGVHAVGASATGATARQRKASAARYAAARPGPAWRIVAALLRPGTA
jgi:GT2 family glycosyltransferase